MAKIKCPDEHCRSSFVYFRRKTDDFACRSCGKTFKRPRTAKAKVV